LSSIRILVVDDFTHWKRQVRSLLQARPECHVIAEASDGSEAIQKAKELKPDLIVLDIGLPNLNGIEAARGIRQVSPNTKIVFLSQNSDLNIVRAALGTGASAYVLKTGAGRELLPAIDAVLRDEQFVSSSLKSYRLTDAPAATASYRHEVLFYSDDTVLLDRVAHFIAAGLMASSAAVVLATSSHQASLLQKLKARGVDTDGALRQGTYISLDSADVLSKIMVNDLPDPARFFGVLGGFIEAGAKAAKSGKPGQSRLVAFGEAVNLLLAQGKPDAAIRLEQIWNDACTTFGLDILCGYDTGNFRGDEDEHVFHNICAEHSAVYSR
jgi:DNA-binding NarL/FixJ family response regulator